MQLVPQNFALKQNFDGSFDGAFPNGDKTPTLLWNVSAFPDLTRKPLNSPVSFNARALLLGDGNGLAVISMIAVSGDGITGWTAAGAGNNCTLPGTVTDAGSFFLRATYLGVNVDGPAMPWSVLGTGTTKFHPAFYMGSNNINGGHDSNANEFNVCAAAGAKVLGWFGIYTWSQFETADGVYDFSMLVNHFNALQAKKPGARFGIMIWCETFSGVTVSFGIPQYILTNSMYGPGADGIHFGYWPLNFGNGNAGGTAAIWRPAVNERYTRLFERLAKASFLTTAGPYAGQTFTFDTHPLIEAIHDQESSLSLATGSDYNEITFANQCVARYIRSAAAFPHTTFAPQINYLNGSPPAVGTLVTGAFNARCGMSWPDTNGVALRKGVSPGVSWGQHFYRGDAYDGVNFVAGGTDRRGQMPCVAWVQQPDYTPYTAVDMLAGMQALQATHGIWTYVVGGNGDWVSAVLPMINANAINNTACPANYNGTCFFD